MSELKLNEAEKSALRLSCQALVDADEDVQLAWLSASEKLLTAPQVPSPQQVIFERTFGLRK